MNLAHLPCGCVIEPVPGALRIQTYDGSALTRSRDQRAVLECPWCASTFDFHELVEWNADNARGVQLSAPCRPLLQFGVRLLEIVGWHDCGAPLVRERESGKQPFHLDAGPDEVVAMPN